jgi:hypothetical protein
MSSTVGVLLKAGTAYPSRAPEFTPNCMVLSVLLIFLVFCVVHLCVLPSELRVVMSAMMFDSSLSSVVCKRVHVLFTLFVFVCRRALVLYMSFMFVCRRVLVLFTLFVFVCA